MNFNRQEMFIPDTLSRECLPSAISAEENDPIDVNIILDKSVSLYRLSDVRFSTISYSKRSLKDDF